MKRTSKIWLVVALFGLAICALVILERRPLSVSSVVERAFGYRMTDEPTVVARKWQKPMAIQGIVYHEETTLRLSENDYRTLVAQLSADRTFQKKEFASNQFYERFVVGKQLVSWRPLDASTREIWFSYTEY